MSKFVTAFYNHDGKLLDSVTLNGRAEVDKLRDLVGNNARVRITDKSVGVHFSVPDDAKIAEFMSHYVDNDLAGRVRIIHSWFAAADATSNDYVVSTDRGMVTLNAFTIGGRITLDAFDTKDQAAMVAAKTWILSKKGAYTSQRDDGTVVFELQVKRAGLNFLGYLVGLEELGQWPEAAKAEGNAWLTPDAVLVFAHGQLLQFSRYSDGTAKALVELAATTQVVPAPVDRDDANLDEKMGWEAFAAAYPSRVTPMLESTYRAFMQGFQGVRFALSCTTDLGHIQTILWVGDEGYPLAQNYIAEQTAGINNGTLCDIDWNFNRRENLLRMHDLPLDLFDVIYAFDLDSAVQFHNDRSELRTKVIVSPTAIALLDCVHVTVVDRELQPGTGLTSAVAYFYQVLLQKYPQRASAILDIMAQKAVPHDAMQVQLRPVGALAEAVDVTIDANEEYAGCTERFSVTDVNGIYAFIRDYDDRESAALVEPTSAVEPVRARGQTPAFLPYDEAPTLDAGEISDGYKPGGPVAGMDEVKNGLETLAALRSQRAPQVDPKPYEASEYDPALSIVIPVVSKTGEPMYNAVFIFEDAKSKSNAMDIGFGAQVAAKLGMDGYKGSLTANNRIGDLPTIADHIRRTALSNAPAIRYYRETL